MRLSQRVLILILLGLFVAPSSTLQGQSLNEDFSIWPVDLRINGTVMACTGPDMESSMIDRFAAGGRDDHKITVIYFDNDFDDRAFHKILERQRGIKKFGKSSALISDSDAPKFESMNNSIASAQSVLLFSSRDLTDEARKLLMALSNELHTTVENNGMVCGVGPVASYFGKIHHESMDELSNFTEGLNLIPDAIVYTNYAEAVDRLSLNSAVSFEPRCVGIGVPAETGIVLSGRKIQTHGKGKTTFTIAANDRQPFRVKHLADINGRSFNPYERVVDLTAWRRDAIDRQLPVFPSANPPQPKVDSGTLFIVGGGRMPAGMMDEFVELAGGSDAHMVYVPCTESATVSDNQWIIRQWRSMGVSSAKVFHTKDRIKANSDEEFLEPMRKATGIWFGGGRQWNFVDSYYGTKAHQLMKDVLKKGGVIGGSSAGASVQGDYLARANPVANFDIMAAGYERGLGFLTGVAIDQHFSQRGRQKDMTQLANRYPQLLGIGIDETTAIKVSGSVAEVIGKGKVFFYDRTKPVIPGKDDFLAVEAGNKFHLVEREIIESKSEADAQTNR